MSNIRDERVRAMAVSVQRVLRERTTQHDTPLDQIGIKEEKSPRVLVSVESFGGYCGFPNKLGDMIRLNGEVWYES